MRKSLLVLFLTLAVGLSACQKSNDQPSKPDQPQDEPGDKQDDPSTPDQPGKDTATYVNVKPIFYDSVKTQTDMGAFYGQTRKSNGYSWDDPLDYGFVQSVWHKLTINDVEIPVYSTRCGYGVHSFAYVDIDTDGTFTLNTQVELLDGTAKQAIILPEKTNVKVTVAASKYYSFSLKDYGDYTLCFGSSTSIKPDKAITIYIAKETKDVVPQGYNEVTLRPGKYDDDDSTTAFPSLRFTDTHTYYRFKKGHYDINSIVVPDDSILYFEPGAYLEVRQDNNYSGFGNSGSSMKILGRCIVDFSHLMGGDAKTKMAFNFNNLSKGAYVEGLISINSNTWTMCFTNCDNLEIAHNMLFGYRTYSDGIMLSGCKDCLTHHNFVRTGDDAIEAKATSARKLDSNNLIYEYNTVWTDKAKAYGVIYESNANVTDVKFRHNSIGFAQPDWHYHVGCLEMQMGTEYTAVWSNVLFEDIEVYYSACTVMNICNTAVNIFSYGDPAAKNYGGTIKNIYFKDIRVNRLVTTNDSVPAYMFAINYVVADGHPEYIDHLKLGKLYVDNAYLGKTLLTKENYSEFSLINLPEDFVWSTGNLKWNSNPTIDF